MRILLCIAALAGSAHVFAQPAAPPDLSVGAEFKGLRFDWEPVPLGNNYQLQYRACFNCSYVGIGPLHSPASTHLRFRLPLHLFDWSNARYRLRACTPTNCTPSPGPNQCPVSQCVNSPAVSASRLRLDAVGYFKAGHSRSNMQFGSATDLSPDGLNFVSAAPGDLPGTVYVFRREADWNWIERARLEPQPDVVGGVNQLNVSVSADGNTVALGMIGCNEVFVFHFDGQGWVRTRIRGITTWKFGQWVSLNDAGDTLATARGVNLDPKFPRHVDVYRLIDGSWRPINTLEEPPGPIESCGRPVMSGDGSTIAEPCHEGGRVYVRTHSGPGWSVRDELPLLDSAFDRRFENTGIGIDATGDTIAAQVLLDGTPPVAGPGIVHVFKRSAGAYTRVTTLMPGSWRQASANSSFGFNIAVSGDGGTIAIGDSFDNGIGNGVQKPPLARGQAPTGAIYVYRFEGSWRLANVVKPNYHPRDVATFGEALALNSNGHTLIVGEAGESSDAVGIDGDWVNTSALASGAVWMY